MDCYPKANTSPFVCDPLECNPSSCDPKLRSHCYWDESLLECLHDFSGGSQHVEDFQVNTDATLLTSMSGATSGERDTTYYEGEHNDEGYGGHAALHYEDIEEAGPPARPQEFPTPLLHEGVRTTIRAVDHRTENVRVIKNVLMALGNVEDMKPTTAATLDRNIVDRAYLLKKRISKSSYGNRYLSVVLQRILPSRRSSFNDRENEKRPEYDWNGVEWESTEEFVIVNVSPWSEAMRRHRRSLALKREGPVHAIAAMQHVGNYHPHVLGCLAVFSDEQHLYSITPFGGIDLQTKILSNREQGIYTPNETEARVIFTQLLQGLFHLQRKGVCHSNLSLENVYIDRNNQNLVIADLGRSFRVPYSDPSNFGCLTGEAEGTTRRLLQLIPHDFASHPTENLMYLAPEIVENENAFDGFAADLWAAGCILFVLLVGMAPFKTSHYWDAAYSEIASGNLKGLLASLNINLSEEATGLLQNMFWRDPRDRLTLAQIKDHAWVKNERFPSRSSVASSTNDTSTPRNIVRSRLSNADCDSASSTSSYATDKSEKARLSTGSRSKALSKALTGLFGGSSRLMSSSISSRNSHGRRSSLGGLSSTASTASAASPASGKSIAEEEGKQAALDVQALRLPSL